MEVNVEVKEGPPITGIIKIIGFIETPQARQLRKVLDEIEDKGIGRLFVDMTEVSFVSSTGISLLVSYANTKRGDWGANPVVLISPQPDVNKAMQVLGVANIFMIMKDLDSALSKFGLS